MKKEKDLPEDYLKIGDSVIIESGGYRGSVGVIEKDLIRHLQRKVYVRMKSGLGFFFKTDQVKLIKE